VELSQLLKQYLEQVINMNKEERKKQEMFEVEQLGQRIEQLKYSSNVLESRLIWLGEIISGMEESIEKQELLQHVFDIAVDKLEDSYEDFEPDELTGFYKERWNFLQSKINLSCETIKELSTEKDIYKTAWYEFGLRLTEVEIKIKKLNEEHVDRCRVLHLIPENLALVLNGGKRRKSVKDKIVYKKKRFRKTKKKIIGLSKVAVGLFVGLYYPVYMASGLPIEIQIGLNLVGFVLVWSGIKQYVRRQFGGRY